MIPIDWDGYLDGSMPDAARQALDRRLQDEPALQRDLAGFREFKKAVREAGMGTDVPDDRLARTLSSVVGAKPKPAGPSLEKWALRLSPVFGIVLAYAVVTNWPTENAVSARSIAIAMGPPIAHCRIEEPAKVAAWMKEKAPLDVPPLNLPSSSRLTGVKAGTNWAAWSIETADHAITLYVAKTDGFDGAPFEELNGLRLYKSPWGFGWRQGGYSYYVDGCNPTVLRQFILEISDRLPLDK